MVRGKTIDPAAVAAFAERAHLVVAHKVAFDRRFLERLSDAFVTKPWACSMSEVDWAGEEFEGTKPAYLATGAGLFYDRHRATNDCLAAIALLAKITQDFPPQRKARAYAGRFPQLSSLRRWPSLVTKWAAAAGRICKNKRG